MTRQHERPLVFSMLVAVVIAFAPPRGYAQQEPPALHVGMLPDGLAIDHSRR